MSLQQPDPQFSVDTGLFRQLGELLVGRDSTAIIELIKNAYDADATTIVLRGDQLDDIDNAALTVADNGTGMTGAQFRRGFLTLAARGKTEGERRSPVYRRRFTGEKGVGRLAAHKLAACLDVISVAAVDVDGDAVAIDLRAVTPEASGSQLSAMLHKADHTVVTAQIDWDKIEEADTISAIVDGLSMATDKSEGHPDTGTTLRLTRLRHSWNRDDMRDVVRQLHNFEPPRALVEQLPQSTLEKTLLFSTPTVRDAERGDPGLHVELDGDFENPQEFWGGVQANAEWILEIRSSNTGEIAYALSPTRVGKEANPFCEPVTATLPHPAPAEGPFFDARIMLRPGKVPTLESSWAELNSGIRVYLEGFRVLPYGEPRNDWLSLDYDYTKRTGKFQIDPLLGSANDNLVELRELTARDVSLRLMPNRNFFGAVFLTEAGAGGLRTLVNREGFVPDQVYDRLVEIVGVGLRLLHRARARASRALAAHEKALKEERKAEEERLRAEEAVKNGDQVTHESAAQNDDADSLSSDSTDESDNESDDTWFVAGDDGSTRGSAAGLRDELGRLRDVLGLSLAADPATQGSIERALDAVDDAADRLIEDTSLLRVLASVGAQLTAFTHEVAQLIPSAAAAEAALVRARGAARSPEIREAQRAVTDVRHALERQASYLVDVASTDGRRRRSRQKLRERINVAILGFAGAAAERSIEVFNQVADDVRTPPMFRAELQAVLTNVLSNAIKAAGHSGRVEVTANQVDSGVTIVVQNTGVRVEPDQAESWFTPYASTSVSIDPVLGQGMGLGLPITRDLISEYGGSVRFREPGESWATAIAIEIPE